MKNNLLKAGILFCAVTMISIAAPASYTVRAEADVSAADNITVTPTPEVTQAPTPTPEVIQTPTPTPEPVKEGLAKLNGKVVYYKKNGTLLKNDSKVIGKYKYVFGKKGYLTRKYKYYKPGWILKKGKYYYKQDDGSIYKKKGLRKIGKYYYYLNKDYSRFSGFKKIKGNYYYFRDKNGRRYEKKGWLTVNKQKYYIRKNYSVVTGAFKINGKKYWFDTNGVLQKNKSVIQYNGKYYEIDKNGVMKKISEMKAQASIATWKFINQHSSPDQTNEQRFRACFNYLEAFMRFRPKPFDKRNYEGDDWPYRYVLSMLNSGLVGNCYAFACTVASVAKELGYEPYVVVTTGDHGFVIIDGKYYDNMGALFGATSHTPYGIYKMVKF